MCIKNKFKRLLSVALILFLSLTLQIRFVNVEDDYIIKIDNGELVHALSFDSVSSADETHVFGNIMAGFENRDISEIHFYFGHTNDYHVPNITELEIRIYRVDNYGVYELLYQQGLSLDLLDDYS